MPQNIMHQTRHHPTIRSKCSQNTSDNGTPSQKHWLTQASHFRVTDVLGIFTAMHDSLTEKARKIRTFTHKDNVHLTPAGYRLLAEEIVLDCNIISSKQQSTAKQLRTPTASPSEEKMWRGFRTTRGFGRTSVVPQRGRGGPRYHPYRRN